MSKIRISTKTDRNKKESNEDSLIAIRQDERAILCVADGVGGLDAGEIASRYITKTIEAWAKDKDVNKMGEKSTHREFTSLVARMHEDLLAVSQDKGIDLGSTFVLAVVGKGRVVIENIGDSRAYVCQRGNCKQITLDQSALWYDLVTGCNYDYIGGALRNRLETATDEEKDHTLLQCIGNGERIPIPVKYAVSIDEDVDILLCSDGLTNRIEEYEIRSELAKKQSGTKVIENLMALAKKRGETDNITAVLYRRRGGE